MNFVGVGPVSHDISGYTHFWGSWKVRHIRGFIQAQYLRRKPGWRAVTEVGYDHRNLILPRQQESFQWILKQGTAGAEHKLPSVFDSYLNHLCSVIICGKERERRREERNDRWIKDMANLSEESTEVKMQKPRLNILTKWVYGRKTGAYECGSVLTQDSYCNSTMGLGH